jgi:hypothetical protein
MQLASIPKNVLTANQTVASHLTTAHQLTSKAQGAVESAGSVGPTVVKDLQSALESATQAREGVNALGKGNLLDGTFQRYSNHAVRHLTSAVAMLDRKGPLSDDGISIFTRTLFDAEVATRLGSAAGERSLANPKPRDLERAKSFGNGGGSSSSSGGPAWVDGQWLDELGNPVRGGGDSWTGPDGVSYGWDGGPSHGGGHEYVGPDGVGYSGI